MRSNNIKYEVHHMHYLNPVLSSMTTSSSSSPKPNLQFPTHLHPRSWLITSATSPIGTAVARAVLAHGDKVVLGIEPKEFEQRYGKSAGKGKWSFADNGNEAADSQRAEDFSSFVDEANESGWRENCRMVSLDGRCESLFLE
jgi:hypothetical protein